MHLTKPWTRGQARTRTRPRRGWRRRFLVWGTSLLGGLLVLVASFAIIGAVAGTHTMGSVTYAQIPPTGGDHSPVWQHCGFYPEPIRAEHAVHSLEHGAVWITYRPGLPAAEIDLLRTLAKTEPKVLVSPIDNLPAPVVVSAWNQQTRLDGAADPRLGQLVRAYHDGPDAPEPDAACDGPNLWLTGGTGDPE